MTLWITPRSLCPYSLAHSARVARVGAEGAASNRRAVAVSIGSGNLLLEASDASNICASRGSRVGSHTGARYCAIRRRLADFVGPLEVLSCHVRDSFYTATSQAGGPSSRRSPPGVAGPRHWLFVQRPCALAARHHAR